MENVTTANLDTGSLIISFWVTNRAIVISSLSHCEFIVLFHTIGIHARQTLLFTFKTTADVTTRKHFVAIFIHKVSTHIASTNCCERRHLTYWWLCQLRLTESALESFFVLFVLFACLKFVVRFLEASWIWAEIFLTLSTSHAIFTHTLSSLSSNWFIVPILLVHIYFSLLDTHYVSTVTPYEIWIFFHKVSQDDFIIFFSLITEVHIEFLFGYNLLAIIFRTSNIQTSLGKLK